MARGRVEANSVRHPHAQLCGELSIGEKDINLSRFPKYKRILGHLLPPALDLCVLA